MNGALIVDKPKGMTSHDVVARVRRLAQERSVGHLGTLDPMATGVLPLVLGKLTRIAQFYGASEKEYEGTIRLGFATDTYDAAGDPTGPLSPVSVTLKNVQLAASEFVGQIDQVPPPFSAKKIQGVPAYKLARRHQPVELKPVSVQVWQFDIAEAGTAAYPSGSALTPGTPAAPGDLTSDNEHYDKSSKLPLNPNESPNTFAFRTRVSAGTYIRSLAHDLGQNLGVGAHLASLRRTRSGEFDLSQSHTLDELERLAAAGDFQNALIPAWQLLPQMPSVVASDDQMVRVRHGNSVNLPEFSQASLIRIFTPAKDLAAIASRIAGTLFQPKIVLI